MQTGREEGTAQGLPLPAFTELPQGQWGRSENETPRPWAQGCDPRQKRIREASRGNGRVTGVGGGEQHKLCCPHPRQGERALSPVEPWSASAPLWPLLPGLPGGSGHLQTRWEGAPVGLWTREGDRCSTEAGGWGPGTLPETSKTFKHH